MSDWFETLEGLHGRAWAVLETGAGKASATARLPVLASLSSDGAPEARSVALRHADRAAGRVSVHTDIASGKIAGIDRDPRVSLHLWDPAFDLQLRLRGTASILTGKAAAAIWANVPDASRGNYGVTPAPGTPIPQSGAYSRAPNPDRFAVLTITLAQIDVVHLGADHHRRALFSRAEIWAGHWLAP